ncbi:MAG: hypothetical protein Q7S08_00740 [bacterium]|nr:hypothetical protein [bacterium]
MGWFPLSVIAGILAGVGLIFARGAVSSGMASYLFVGIMGLVYVLGAGAQAIVRGENIWNIAGYAILMGIVAGAFFFIQNVLQYKAITMTPLISYLFLAVTISTLLVLLGYDIVQMYRAGTLATISYYSLAAIILSVVALVLFQVAPRQ